MTGRAGTRLGAAFVLVLLSLGSLVLWIGVPVAGMWLAGELTDSSVWHMPVAMVLVVAGIIVFAAALAWLNDLYLRVSGGRSEVAPGGVPVRRRGPLESLLVAALIMAIVAFAAWFLLLAENPDLRMW